MPTTLSTKFANANYSSPPTIDVEILDNTAIHCATLYCNEEVVNDATGYALPQWRATSTR